MIVFYTQSFHYLGNDTNALNFLDFFHKKYKNQNTYLMKRSGIY